MKVCLDCKVSKPLDQFATRKKPGGRLLHVNPCKPCYNLRAREYRKAKGSGVVLKSRVLKSKYNITIDYYYLMLSAQNGVCYICQEPPEIDKYLYVDHDHNCCPGQKTCGSCVRGLLCLKCNTGLGMFKDNLELIERAAHYLSQHTDAG